MLSESVEPMQYASDFYTVVSFTDFQSPHVLSGAALLAFTEMLIHAELFLFFSSLIAVQQSCLTFLNITASYRKPSEMIQSFRVLSDLHCL